MVAVGRIAFLVVAVLLAAGLFVQVFLAGLGVFAGATNFETHRDTGYTLELVAIILIIAGLIGRVGRRLIGMSVVVFLLFLLQSVFIGLRSSNPEVAALHPVNGFVIVLLTLLIVRDAWAMRQAGATA